jgi:hypothetical protein
MRVTGVPAFPLWLRRLPMGYKASGNRSIHS